MKKLFIILTLSVVTYSLMAKEHFEISLEDDRVIVFGKTVSGYEIDYKGIITLSDDDKNVKAISANGFLIISRASFGNVRKIEIRSDNSGRLTKKYFEGKNELDFKPNGEQWLADILPTVVRKTSIGTEYRVKRIYGKSGIDGLIKEIEEINDVSGSARNIYFAAAIKEIDFSDADLIKLLPEMEMINSNSTKGSLIREILYKYDLSDKAVLKLLETTRTLDYNTERGSTLRVLNPKLPKNKEVIEAYFYIIDDMSINSEKGNVLKHLIVSNSNTPHTFKAMLRSISNFSSEREKGAVLLHMIDFLPEDEEVLKEFNHAVQDISSHYYVLKGEILNALTNKHLGHGKSKPGINKSVILSMLNTARGYDSNSQKGLTLRQVNRIFIDDVEVLDKYFDVLNSIDAELERYNVMLDLIHRNKLSDRLLIEIFDANDELIDDDYQHAAGAVLRACIPKMSDNDQVIYAFFENIDEMDQNSTIEEILRLVIQNDNLNSNEEVIAKTIDALDRIDVDIEKALILERVKPIAKKSKESVYAYKSAAKDINSNYWRRRVMLDMEK